MEYRSGDYLCNTGGLLQRNIVTQVFIDPVFLKETCSGSLFGNASMAVYCIDAPEYIPTGATGFIHRSRLAA